MTSTKEIRTIGIAYNLKKGDAHDDRDEEYDEKETIDSLAAEIERYGFEVLRFEQDDDFVRKISTDRPDFVLNISEGKGNTRARESQVPCILENLGIPYSGSDPVALGITLDKYLTNLVLRSAGVPVPTMYSVSNEKEISSLRDIFTAKKHFIVKPRWEGSSKGIFLNSVVAGHEELRERASQILAQYRQPALIEQFLENDEVTVALCGNKEPEVLGMMRIVPVKSDERFFVYSLENKRDWREKIRYEPESSLPENSQKLLRQYALMAFHALELRDLARIDFRLDKDRVPNIIDINPLPGLSPNYSDLCIMFRLSGKEYSELIKKILKASFDRHGFNLSNFK